MANSDVVSRFSVFYINYVGCKCEEEIEQVKTGKPFILTMWDVNADGL